MNVGHDLIIIVDAQNLVPLEVDLKVLMIFLPMLSTTMRASSFFPLRFSAKLTKNCQVR